jgi:hypothetical protein
LTFTEVHELVGEAAKMGEMLHGSEKVAGVFKDLDIVVVSLTPVIIC